jgi:hypothetical protein
MRLALAFLLVAALALPCAAADFAIDKGAWVLGGSVGFEMQGGDLYENPDGDSRTVIEFDPGAGYFLMPGLLAGTRVVFVNSSQGDHKSSSFGIGPVVAYYFGGPYSSMYPFVSARFTWVSHSTENAASVDWSETNISFAAGATKMISRNVGIRAAVFYSIDSYSPDEGDSIDGNRMGLRIGLESFIW